MVGDLQFRDEQERPFHRCGTEAPRRRDSREAVWALGRRAQRKAFPFTLCVLATPRPRRSDAAEARRGVLTDTISCTDDYLVHAGLWLPARYGRDRTFQTHVDFVTGSGELPRSA